MKSLSPKLRLCVTSTPLRPLVSFSMVNMGMLGKNFNVLDPFAGSCSTLLAAASIESSCNVVGVERSIYVDFSRVHDDFSSRGLPKLCGLIRGDSSKREIREEARNCVSNNTFDLIVCDPPYGLREKLNQEKDPAPIVELLRWIKDDRDNGTPLLKVGGRIVAFCPTLESNESTIDGMPDDEQMSEAGVRMVTKMKQPMNEALSRWLIVLECIE